MEPGDFLGEYTGETISKEEGFYRDNVYELRDMAYSFTIDNNILLDPISFGNKVIKTKQINYFSYTFLNFSYDF